MKWKRTCREVFQDQLKLHILFWGIAVGRFKCEKSGDHQQKEFFINNAVKAQEESSGPTETACTFGGNFYCGKKVSPSRKEGIFSES